MDTQSCMCSAKHLDHAGGFGLTSRGFLGAIRGNDTSYPKLRRGTTERWGVTQSPMHPGFRAGEPKNLSL